MTQVHLDYETRSLADIRDVGTYRYAEDASTEIFCAAVAVGDWSPKIWINPKFEVDDGFSSIKSDLTTEELTAILESADEVWAHNAQFEHAITRYQGIKHGIVVPDHKWRCTAALCRRAAIPASLEKSAETLGLTEQKDSGGKRLIQKFSIPDSKGVFRQPRDHAADFQAFIAYCLQDVRVEQQIHRELKAFNMSRDVLAAFQVDLAINARGIEVNLPALLHAQGLIEKVEHGLKQEFKDLCGFLPSQTAVFSEWLKEQGYRGDNLRAATVDEVMDDESFDSDTVLGKALILRKKMAFASIKKIKTMIAWACSDASVRGTLLIFGAGPGRHAGRGIQPQNFKRPDKKINTVMAYADICAGMPLDELEFYHGNIIEVLASCIRHFLQPHKGVLLDIDFSNIEARLVNWYAGQQDAVDDFSNGVDNYCKMASVIYGRPINKKEHEFPERFVGKQATLGAGYSMGGPKFRMTCKSYGYDLPWEVDVVERNKKTGDVILSGSISREDAALKLAQLRKEARATDSKKKYRIVTFEDRCIRAYRDTHKEVCKFWYACEKAAKNAIMEPGSKFAVGKVTFFCATTAGAKYLFIVLPSGRRIAYRNPQVHTFAERITEDDDDFDPDGSEEDNTRRRTRITYWSQITATKWGPVDIYGGLIVENICQGTAADLLNNGIVKAEAAGIEIANLIHDQCLAYCRNADEAPARLKLLEKCFLDVPAWADGLPVAVEGKITPYYKK